MIGRENDLIRKQIQSYSSTNYDLQLGEAKEDIRYVLLTHGIAKNVTKLVSSLTSVTD